MGLRVARLCGRVKPTLQDPVQQDGGRRAHIERIDTAAERQRDEVVARGGDARPQALPLGAEDEHDAACDDLVSLPLRGRVDSLNVSATAAVLLYRILQDRLDTST